MYGKRSNGSSKHVCTAHKRLLTLCMIVMVVYGSIMGKKGKRAKSGKKKGVRGVVVANPGVALSPDKIPLIRPSYHGPKVFLGTPDPTAMPKTNPKYFVEYPPLEVRHYDLAQGKKKRRLLQQPRWLGFGLLIG